MGQSVRASKTGLAIANQARQRRGWTKTSTARWWQDAHTSRATLRRFWRGERIQQEAFIAICHAVGLDDWQTVAESSLEPRDEPPLIRTCVDWGEAPDIEQFYGREQELVQLRAWTTDKKDQDLAKLINITGLGGSGKTALALALAEQLQTEFDGIIWRSTKTLLSLDALLESLLDTPIETTDRGIGQLLKKMQQGRWLIILDDFESYLDVLHRLTTARHQSCLWVISHQPLPSQFHPLNRVQFLSLSGLSTSAAVQLLQDCGCNGQTHHLKALARLYSYNPLALKLVASTIQTVFRGQIAPFLEQETVILPDPMRLTLQQQFQTLMLLEKTLIFWLAIWQEPISLCRLQTHLLTPNPAAVMAALSTLVQRSLITRHFCLDEPSFSLHPMVMTFITDQLVKDVMQELIQAQQQQTIQPFQLLRTHCLLRPGTDDILGDRILTALQAGYQQQRSHPPLVAMEHWLQQVQDYAPSTVGYLAFNLTMLRNTLEVTPP